MLGLVSVGATLPVLPRYVRGPLGSGDLAVGVVTGAFAITGLACRPIAGRFADLHGRRVVVIAGAVSTAIAGLLYFVPAGIGGLIVARLFLGAGEGLVYTAGSAWVVDLAPPERRGRSSGSTGSRSGAGSLSGRRSASSSCTPLASRVSGRSRPARRSVGALIALRIPERYEPHAAARTSTGG